MRLRKVLAAAVAGSTVAIAAPADAHTTTCRMGGPYSAVDETVFPAVYNVHAVNLARRTSGYAPRCLVADSIGGLIQQGSADHQRPPRRVRPMGARWDGGVWRVSYHERRVPGEDDVYLHAVARNSRQRVTMDLYS
jgi:hypothetical protein